MWEVSIGSQQEKIYMREVSRGIWAHNFMVAGMLRRLKQIEASS